ncbi:MAG: hypothetical protein AABZ60_06115, partial [Planctomycetota bacterium]
MQQITRLFLLLSIFQVWAQDEKKTLDSYVISQEIAKLSAPLLVLVEIQLVPFNRSEDEILKDFYYLGRNNSFLDETLLENVANDRPFILPGYIVAPEKILIA